jgi:hypothetical protein
MLRTTLAAALSFLLLSTAAGAACGEEAPHQSPRPGPRSGPADLLRLTQAPRTTALCRPGEKLCRTATYITWCCRSDQQCDYSTIGGCR